MPLRVALLLFVSAALLSGCGPRKGAGQAARALGPQAALNAAGEPQWSLQLRGGQMRFSTGDGAPTVVKATRRDAGDKAVAWTGATGGAGGAAAVQVSLTALRKPCQDGSTGMTYPLTATVQVAGTRYAGCAAPPGQGLGPRS